MWEVAASKFTHNKSLLSLLFYFIIIFSLKYPVYSDFFRWHPCNVLFVDLMKGKWIWSVRRGLKTLFMAASKKKEMELTQTLKDHQNRGTPVHVHHDCRRRLTDFRKKPVRPEPKRLRSSIDAAFAWKTCYFLCSKPIVGNKEKFHQVQTLPLHNNIIECAKARHDDWGEAVLTRLGTSNDLVAEVHAWLPSSWTKLEGVLQGDQRIES